MKNLSFVWMPVIVLALALMLVLSACSNEDSGPSAGVAVVTGFVKDASTHAPLADVTVEGVVGTSIAASPQPMRKGCLNYGLKLIAQAAAKITIRMSTGIVTRSTLPLLLRQTNH